MRSKTSIGQTFESSYLLLNELFKVSEEYEFFEMWSDEKNGCGREDQVADQR